MENHISEVTNGILKVKILTIGILKVTIGILIGKEMNNRISERDYMNPEKQRSRQSDF